MTFSLSEIADRFGLELRGNDIQITGVANLDDAGPSDIAFLLDDKFADKLETTKAGAVVVRPAFADKAKTVLVSDAPPVARAWIAGLFEKPMGSFKGISDLAFVHESALVGDNVDIGPFAYVGPKVTIGAGTRIFPGCYVGDGCTIGNDCLLYPNVVLMDGGTLGNKVILQPGSVLGGDGFGYVPGPEGLIKVPQIGSIQIMDNAEIGANTTIDRGSLETTTIGPGSKVDNLTMIAHNVQVGAHSIIVAQTGVSGSTKIGNGVLIAGQVGIVGHLNIGDGARIGSQAGVSRDVPAGTAVSGSPAVHEGNYRRSSVLWAKLPELNKKIKTMEKELAALKEAVAKGEG